MTPYAFYLHLVRLFRRGVVSVQARGVTPLAPASASAASVDAAHALEVLDAFPHHPLQRRQRLLEQYAVGVLRGRSDVRDPMVEELLRGQLRLVVSCVVGAVPFVARASHRGAFGVNAFCDLHNLRQ